MYKSEHEYAELISKYNTLYNYVINNVPLSDKVINSLNIRNQVYNDPTTNYGNKSQWQLVNTRSTKQQCIKGECNELCAILVLHYNDLDVTELADDYNNQVSSNVDIISNDINIQIKTLIINKYLQTFRVYKDWYKIGSQAHWYLATHLDNDEITYTITHESYIRTLTKTIYNYNNYEVIPINDSKIVYGKIKINLD